MKIEVSGHTGALHKVVIQESHMNISLRTEYRDLQEIILEENIPRTIDFEHDSQNYYKLVYEGGTSAALDCEAPQEKNLKIGKNNSVQIVSGCK